MNAIDDRLLTRKQAAEVLGFGALPIERTGNVDRCSR